MAKLSSFLVFASRLFFTAIVLYIIFAPLFGFPEYEFTLQSVFFLLLMAIYIESDRIVKKLGGSSIEISIDGMQNVTNCEDCDCYGACDNKEPE